MRYFRGNPDTLIQQSLAGAYHKSARAREIEDDENESPDLTTQEMTLLRLMDAYREAGDPETRLIILQRIRKLSARNPAGFCQCHTRY